MINNNLELIEKIENSLYDIEIDRGLLFENLQDIIDDFASFSKQYKKWYKELEKEKLEEWIEFAKSA